MINNLYKRIDAVPMWVWFVVCGVLAFFGWAYVNEKLAALILAPFLKLFGVNPDKHEKQAVQHEQRANEHESVAQQHLVEAESAISESDEIHQEMEEIASNNDPDATTPINALIEKGKHGKTTR